MFFFFFFFFSFFYKKVAIAYLMQKTPYVFPLVGGRKVEHLMANIEALEITLSNEQIKFLESVEPFEAGFPHYVIVSFWSFFFQLIFFFFIGWFFFSSSQGDGQENSFMLNATATVTKGPLLQPLRPTWKSTWHRTTVLRRGFFVYNLNNYISFWPSIEYGMTWDTCEGLNDGWYF